MKLNLATILITLTFFGFARADISIECKAPANQRISLDFAGGYYLTDSSEPSLKRRKNMIPKKEDKNSVFFEHDFGSDSSRSIYSFVGLENCGVYSPDTKVVTMTFGIKSFFTGQVQNPKLLKCTCVED